MTTPTMTPQHAANLYDLRTKMARAKYPRSSRDFAEAMSRACAEYEANMARAAAEGDAAAAETLAASVGPYLNPV